jgi:hypothetical protein
MIWLQRGFKAGGEKGIDRRRLLPVPVGVTKRNKRNRGTPRTRAIGAGRKPDLTVATPLDVRSLFVVIFSLPNFWEGQSRKCNQ